MDSSFWRSVIEMFVDQITLNLGTVEFDVVCTFRHSVLQALSGRLAEAGDGGDIRTRC
jgi:hypothetical protein